MKPLVSIVVPVYNVENYLSTCLDSLLDQGLEANQYEIILINDGSIDNSLEICKEYEETHSNISVYSHENQGVSKARNLGFSKAQGEWIMFVDSDDFVCKGSLKYLFDNYCSDKYDGIRFWTRIKGDASIDKEMSCEGKVLFTGYGYDFIRQYGLETFCYTTLYRRDFLEHHDIQFSPYKIGEDFLFASQFLLANPRICSTSSIVYQYLIHPGSASTSRNKAHARKCTYDHLEVNNELIELLTERNMQAEQPDIYEKCLETIGGKMPLIFSRMLSSDISKQEFKQIVKEQRRYGVLPLKTKTSSIKNRLSYFLINFLSSFPTLFPLSKYLFSRIFIPVILPQLSRD